MNINTFGNTEQYKSLKVITEFMDSTDSKTRRKITNFIHSVNAFCINFTISKQYLALSFFTGTQLRRMLNDAKNSYTHSLTHLVMNAELDEKIASYLHNHLVARFRELKKEYANFA